MEIGSASSHFSSSFSVIQMTPSNLLLSATFDTGSAMSTAPSLGWYIVSLLLTGDFRLCRAASQLLPYNETRDGLDIDLSPFSLKSPWVLYLSRKILGYCIVNKESAAALLLSCLRAVSDTDRSELEDLVRDRFLMNYLTATEWFEAAVSSNDPAQQSVRRLSQSMSSYVTELDQAGSCSAFRPNERERQLEAYRLGDFVRGVQKKAEEGSIFFIHRP